jgi:hypothetical protein
MRVTLVRVAGMLLVSVAALALAGCGGSTRTTTGTVGVPRTPNAVTPTTSIRASTNCGQEQAPDADGDIGTLRVVSNGASCATGLLIAAKYVKGKRGVYRAQAVPTHIASTMVDGWSCQGIVLGGFGCVRDGAGVAAKVVSPQQ